MSRTRVALACAAALAAAAAAIPACGFALDQGLDSAAGTGGWGSSTGAGDASVDVGPDGDMPDPYFPYTELCGSGCKPGDLDGGACDPGAGGGGGAGGNGGAGGSGGAGSGNGGGAPAPSLGCQLVYENEVATPMCGPAGGFGAEGPCQSVSDCLEGHGCVLNETQTGTCRQYCCGHIEDCAQGTYCQPRPMLEAATAGVNDVLIPVCIPATGCELLSSDCGDDLACTIVREDGTTSCVEPGTGVAGDECWCIAGDCSCASGFVCSLFSNECKKLCHLGMDHEDCGEDATCQGGSMAYPPDFGICVGGSF
jgi:hypothetical protein